MSEPSTKPYLIRAIHEWCVDSGFTPYLAVVADQHTLVPQEFVRDGEIVLNIGPLATNKLSLGNDWIEFEARFSGIARQIAVPIGNVFAIYAKESGQGMTFEVQQLEVESCYSAPAENAVSASPDTEAKPKKSHLSLVK